MLNHSSPGVDSAPAALMSRVRRYATALAAAAATVAIAATAVFALTPAAPAAQESAPAGSRFAVREATATKGALAQAAGESTAEDLGRFLESLTANVEGSLASSGAGTAVARTELDTILKEQSLADSGLVDRLDPQAAKSFQLSGVSAVVTISVTDFSVVKEILEVEGRFGKTKAERWDAEATGVARAYDTTSGALIAEAKFSVNQVRTNEPMAGTERNATPLARMVGHLATDAADSIGTNLGAKMKAAGISGGNAAAAGASAAAGSASAPATDSPAVLIITRITAKDISPEASAEWQSLVSAAVAREGYGTINASDSILTMDESAFNRVIGSRTSISNLAQSAGAGGVLIATIDSLTEDRRTLSDPSVAAAKVTEWTMAGSWRMLGPSGSSVLGGTVTDRKAIQQTQTLEIDTNVRSGLLRNIASSIGRESAAARAPLAAAQVATAGLQLVVIAADLGVPDLRLGADGSVAFTTTTLPVTPEGCTVLVDGIGAGHAPGTVGATPGLHTIRVEHPFFEPWENTVRVTPDMVLAVTMKPTAAAWEQWRNQVAFLENIKRVEQDRIESALDQATARRVLESNAEAQLIRAKGLAEFLKRSQLNLDTTGVQFFAPGNGGLDVWLDILNGR